MECILVMKIKPILLENIKIMFYLEVKDTRTGENQEGGKLENLRIAAKKFFPLSKEVMHWSAQDCITSDQIPFIGNYALIKPDWFVGNGISKMGYDNFNGISNDT